MYIERAPIISAAIGENLKSLKGGLVGIDIDAITQRTIYKALNYASLKLDRTVAIEEITDYWKLATLAMDKGMSRDEASNFAKVSFNREEVYRRSPPVPGITTLLKIFRWLEIPHLFISSRPPEFLEITKEWFFKNFSWINPNSIILNRPKGMSGGDYKAGVIEREDVLLHFEDAIDEADIIVRKTQACVLMPALPWNINTEINHPRIRRVGPYNDNSGVWPVVKFLANPEAKQFLSVAQY